MEFGLDEFGCTWATCRRVDGDLTTLTTQLHGVNTTLDDAGLGSSLLCTVSGFASNPVDGPERRLGLVYLFARGTVYPFAPVPGEQRDTVLELQVRALLTGELPIEPVGSPRPGDLRRGLSACSPLTTHGSGPRCGRAGRARALK